MEETTFISFMGNKLSNFLAFTGFANVTLEHLIMIVVGMFFLWLAIKKEFEPMLLVPIGFGILIGNIPFSQGMEIGIYEEGSVLNILYNGVSRGWYPPLIFLGIGAMTDFSSLIANPKLMLVGAAPGEQEDLSGIPFVGKAGQLLDKYLFAVDIPRDKVYIANILK